MTSKQKTIAWLVGGALVAAVAIAMVVGGPSGGGSTNGERTGVDLDTELETFLRSRARILKIEQQVREVQQHPNAEAKPEVMQRLYDQANAAIVSVLNEEGMSLGRYNDLQRRMQSDEDLAARTERVLKRMERRVGTESDATAATADSAAAAAATAAGELDAATAATAP